MVISPLSFHVLSTISVTFNQEKRIEIGVDTEIGGYREFQHRCYINVTTSIEILELRLNSRKVNILLMEYFTIIMNNLNSG